jgi:putative chitinase
MALPIQLLAAPDVAATTPLSLSSEQVLSALVLAGVLGMVGQTVRAVVGLKKMNDDADSTGVSANDLFIASRLVTSEIIGFVVGVITALSLDINRLVTVTNVQVLLGIAAAGYAGTDVIESFARRLGGAGGGRSKGTSAGPKPTIGKAGESPTPA